MKGLLSDSANELTNFKANVAIRAAEVKAASISAAALISTTGFVAVPHISTNEDAQEEANRQNFFRLACVGAKEQMAQEITAKVGANITNPVLRHADGVQYK